ncbi:MAG: hypothetical protein QOK48_3294 [Blastocatellia bacterium]|nr:hypothetical protein [Blastocatellia bacterium]
MLLTVLVAVSCSSLRSPSLTTNTNAANTNAGNSSGSTSSPQNSTQSTANTPIKSIYSDFEGKGCGASKTTGEISAERTCAGIEGYKLLILTDDDRDSITVITPNGKQHPLDFWDKISKGAFNALGQKAEWRVDSKSGKDVPIALIVRVDVQSEEKKTSYLAVSKITDQKICVTDRIAPGADQNEKARVAADASASKPCL